MVKGSNEQQPLLEILEANFADDGYDEPRFGAVEGLGVMAAEHAVMSRLETKKMVTFICWLRCGPSVS